MNKPIKKFQRDSLTLAGTGIALGTLSSFDSSGATSSLSAGVGKVAPLVPFKLTTDILLDINNNINKKRRRK